VAKPAVPKDPAYVTALALYEQLVATVPGLEVKGDANRYTSLNGNMSSYLHPRGEVALRLAATDRAEFLARHETTLFEAYGVVQKEYVAVPSDLLADLDALAPWFRKSHDYVAALKPKPTTRKKSAG
jgi:hypothetical protein